MKDFILSNHLEYARQHAEMLEYKNICIAQIDILEGKGYKHLNKTFDFPKGNSLIRAMYAIYNGDIENYHIYMKDFLSSLTGKAYAISYYHYRFLSYLINCNYYAK